MCVCLLPCSEIESIISIIALEELSQEIARWLDDPVMEDKMILRNSVKVTSHNVILIVIIILYGVDVYVCDHTTNGDY